MEHALLPTDFSQSADLMTKNLKDLRELGIREIHLLHAMNLSPHHHPAFHQAMEENRDRDLGKLKKRAGWLEDQGFETSYSLTPGIAERDVISQAEEHDTDLIVMGSRGASVLREAFLGGTTLRVLQRTKHPLIVYPIQLKEGSDEVASVDLPHLTDHLVHPTDFSEYADGAFEQVKQLAAADLGRVSLIHAIKEDEIGPEVEQAAEHELNSRAEELPDDVAVETHVLNGNPIQAILEYVETEDGSVVVMSNQGKGFIKQVFLGSVSHNVIRETEIPVISVPASRLE